MKCKKVNIATARILGLTNHPYYWEHHCYYIFDIQFANASTLAFRNLTFIKMGDTEKEAELFCNQLKENFKEAHIYNGNQVAVMFDDDGDVMAIGCIGKDSWIDVCDKFTKKTFEELNIVITSLKVY